MVADFDTSMPQIAVQRALGDYTFRGGQTIDLDAIIGGLDLG